MSLRRLLTILRQPRYSLRALALLVTIVCLYFGLWSLTKSQGIDAISRFSIPRKARYLLEKSSPGPLVVTVVEARRDVAADVPAANIEPRSFYRRRYLWLLGAVVELPWKTPYDGTILNGAT